MQFLKQSTGVTLKIGPFIDETDGKTAETGLTITQADVRLSKNGGNIAQKTESTACTHDELGIYGCPIDSTDTATLGRLQLWVHESGALPVWHEFLVVTANVWDSLCSTDKLQVDATQIEGGDATDAINAACDAAIETYNLDALAPTAGTVSDVSPSSTQFDTDLSETTNDHYNDQLLIFTDGSLAGQSRHIEDYTGSSKNIELSPAFTGAPGNGDAFAILTIHDEPLVHGFEAAAKAEIKVEAVAALADINLDHLVFSAVPSNLQGVVADNSILGYALATSVVSGYNRTDDSQQATRDQGDSAWISATGFSTHAAADIWSDASGVTILADVAAIDALTEASGAGDLAAIKTAVDAVLADTGTDGVVVAATGLDSITATAPGGVATTFPQMIVQLYRRFFKKSTLTATEVKTYADNGSDVETTQTVSDDATTQTQGAAS